MTTHVATRAPPPPGQVIAQRYLKFSTCVDNDAGPNKLFAFATKNQDVDLEEGAASFIVVRSRPFNYRRSLAVSNVTGIPREQPRAPFNRQPCPHRASVRLYGMRRIPTYIQLAKAKNSSWEQQPSGVKIETVREHGANPKPWYSQLDRGHVH